MVWVETLETKMKKLKLEFILQAGGGRKLGEFLETCILFTTRLRLFQS